jgi:hypothetical protein
MARSTLCGDTGQSTTVTFTAGLTSWGGKVTSIEFSDETLNELNCSHLGTTGTEATTPSDLQTPLEVTINYLFDTFDTPPKPGMYLGTGTVTFPRRIVYQADGVAVDAAKSETTAANIAGSAYCKSSRLPRLALGELQTGTFVFKFDNNAIPVVFTKAT